MKIKQLLLITLINPVFVLNVASASAHNIAFTAQKMMVAMNTTADKTASERPPIDEKPIIADGKRFFPEGKGFSIVAPGGWEIKNNVPGISLLIQIPYIKDTYQRTIQVLKGSQTFSFEQSSIDEFVQKLVLARSRLSMGLQNYALRNNSVIQLEDGTKALLIYTSFLLGDTPMMEMHIVAPSADGHYLMTYTDRAEIFDTQSGKVDLDIAYNAMITMKMNNPAPSEFNFLIKIGVGVGALAVLILFFGIMRKLKARRLTREAAVDEIFVGEGTTPDETDSDETDSDEALSGVEENIKIHSTTSLSKSLKMSDNEELDEEGPDTLPSRHLAKKIENEKPRARQASPSVPRKNRIQQLDDEETVVAVKATAPVPAHTNKQATPAPKQPPQPNVVALHQSRTKSGVATPQQPVAAEMVRATTKPKPPQATATSVAKQATATSVAKQATATSVAKKAPKPKPVVIADENDFDDETSDPTVDHALSIPEESLDEVAEKAGYQNKRGLLSFGKKKLVAAEKSTPAVKKPQKIEQPPPSLSEEPLSKSERLKPAKKSGGLFGFKKKSDQDLEAELENSLASEVISDNDPDENWNVDPNQESYVKEDEGWDLTNSDVAAVDDDDGETKVVKKPVATAPKRFKKAG